MQNLTLTQIKNLKAKANTEFEHSMISDVEDLILNQGYTLDNILDDCRDAAIDDKLFNQEPTYIYSPEQLLEFINR